jgi:oligoendopeptidase F
MGNIEQDNETLVALKDKAALLSSEVKKNLSFFNSSLARTSDQYKKTVFGSKVLSNYKNYLDRLSALKKFMLPQDQEELLIDKNVNGISAWAKFRNTFESRYSFMFKGPDDKEPKKYTLTQLSNFMDNQNRDVRQRATEMFFKQYKQDNYVYAQIYNSIIQDEIAIEKNRRGYDPLISVRNIAGQLDNEAVNMMHQVVTDNFKVAQRYWKLKARLMGIKDFNNADTYPPYVPKGGKNKIYTYKQALEILQDTMDSFYKPFGSAFENMYRCGLVHAALRTGKRDNEYEDSCGAGLPPIIMVNFQGDIYSVSAIAHEGGHWIHGLMVSENQTSLNSDPPKATTETASVFNEMLLLSKMSKQNQDNPEELLVFLMAELGNIIPNVFGATANSNFEQAVHKVSEKGPLTPEQFSEIYVSERGKMFGDAVKMVPDYKYGWASVPHFMRPFYMYAYAFGELAAISMYQKYLSDPKTFPEKYMNKFLTAGASMPPQELFMTVGVDLRKKDEAEELAKKQKKI